MKSKRNALRFPGAGLPVSYKTAYDAGEALLINISATGCALQQPSQPLAVAEKILISLDLPGQEQVLQAQGKVVRVETTGVTAIQFTLVEPEDQGQIRTFFSRQMRIRK
jgi:PilZ domain